VSRDPVSLSPLSRAPASRAQVSRAPANPPQTQATMPTTPGFELAEF
jgi:hypothetical protein